MRTILESTARYTLCRSERKCLEGIVALHEGTVVPFNKIVHGNVFEPYACQHIGVQTSMCIRMESGEVGEIVINEITAVPVLTGDGGSLSDTGEPIILPFGIDVC